MWRAKVRITQAGGSVSVTCHARVLGGANYFKIVDIHDFVQLTKSRIQGEFLQKSTFCTISFRWTNPFLHFGVVGGGSHLSHRKCL